MAVTKVADLPYKRYTIEEGKAAFEKFENAMKEAMCANCVMRARKAFSLSMSDLFSYLLHTIRDGPGLVNRCYFCNKYR